MEKLRKVKSFSELRTGMLVVRNCPYCGGRHRQMLLNAEAGTTFDPDGSRFKRQVVFGVVPDRACLPSIYDFDCVSPDAVTDGLVYRVIDEEPTQETRARELELAR